MFFFFFFLMIRRPPRSTLDRSSAASDVYKRQTWFELSEVIAREKFDRYFPGESRIDFLLVLARISQFIEPSVSITDCIDPSDNRFLELALCAESEIIISGDDHLRSMNPWRGIAIASPSEFLQRYA